MTEYYQIIIPLIAGFILDIMLGDPLWLPHPVRLFGRLISLGDNKLNYGNRKQLKGVLLVIALVVLVLSVFIIIEIALKDYTIAKIIFESVMVFYGIANRNLISEALKVEKKLTGFGIEEGRKQLSYIVGRETSRLPENKVRTAILETLSENLSDGVVAPLFCFAIGGVPLMFAYKMINTLDSMIGYKSEKYIDFGRFAAKLDDVANYLPARITALLMVMITFSIRGLKFIYLFGNKHASPNAGYPEAALAGILNCRLGGPNIYYGKIVDKPYIGTNNRDVVRSDIYKACVVNLVVTLFLVGAIGAVWYIKF